MITLPRPRRSAVTFDLGAAGIRACQLATAWLPTGPAVPRSGDSLQLERLPADTRRPAATRPGPDSAAGPEPCPAPPVDAQQLRRLIGQGRFAGHDVAFVLSPPDVEFFPLHLPEQILTQPPDRIEQALKWEVARGQRAAPEDLEIRYWHLPRSASGGTRPGSNEANVMAAAVPCQLALQWCEALQRSGLNLRHIDVSPCALTRLACQFVSPADSDLWGVLDLGLRHTTFTVVVGRVPTYIRSLSTTAQQWTDQIATAFEIAYPVAEQLKRSHGLCSTSRGRRAAMPAAAESDAARPASLREAGDLSEALSSVLGEPLQTLIQEVGRCFSYVMQAFPDHTVQRLLLAGGGATLSGLDAALQAGLDVPVARLGADAGPEAATWARVLPAVRLTSASAAAVGGALLDLEAA